MSMSYARRGTHRPRQYWPDELPSRFEGTWTRVVATVIFIAGVLLGGFIGVGIWRFATESYEWRDKLHDLRNIEGEIQDLIDEILNFTVPSNCTFSSNETQPYEYPDATFRIFDDTDPTARFGFNDSLISSSTTQLLTSQNVSGQVLLLEELDGLGTTFLDSLFAVQNVVNNTREVMFDLSGVTAGETSVLTIPDASGVIALLTDIPVFPSVFLDSNFTIVGSGDPSKAMMLNCSLISSATTRVLTVQDRDCTVAYLHNIGNATGPPFSDAIFEVYADLAPSAVTQFDLSVISTATTISMTVQDRGGVIAYLSNIVQIVEVFVNTSRTFPDVAFEGVSTLSELGYLTHIEITLCGGGGAAYGDGGDGKFGGSGGSSSAIKDFFILTPNGKFDQFNCTVGAGGDSGGIADPGNNTIVLGDSSTGFFVELIAYGGGVGTKGALVNPNRGGGGGGGGSGGIPLNNSVPGIAGDLGGVEGGIGSVDGSVPDCYPGNGKFKAPWWSGFGGSSADTSCVADNAGWQGGFRYHDPPSLNRPGGPSLFGVNILEVGQYCFGGNTNNENDEANGGGGLVLFRYYVRG